MPYTSHTRVTNEQSSTIQLHFEPRGDQFIMQPGDSFDVFVESEEPGMLEITVKPGIITVYTWSLSKGRVMHNGKELAGTNF
jgi:hypothetical protein